MSQTKTILWITALAIFSIAGCYLSGYILLTMLKPSQVVLEWHTWFKYFEILAAPTRSGKVVGMVVPNLLSDQGSMVVLDIKQANF